jgi:transposase
MIKKYIVTLTDSERQDLQALIAKGRGAARRLIHARILLKADQGLPDPAIGEAVEISRPSVERVRRRFVEEGLEAALDPRRPGRPRPHKIDGEVEARLIAGACSTPPPGKAHWSLRLLADKIVELEYLDAVSHATVRRSLQKTSRPPGASRNG